MLSRDFVSYEDQVDKTDESVSNPGMRTRLRLLVGMASVVLMVCLLLPLLAIACYAQSVSTSFNDLHAEGVRQNPPGVTFTIATTPANAAFHVSDDIEFKVTIASTKPRYYTADIGGGGSAAAVSFDLIVQGPGMPGPMHSQLSHHYGFVCCSSKRRYLTQKGVTGPAFRVSLRRMEQYANNFIAATSFEPGDYVVFAQTRTVMRGWPKSEHDSYHTVSDFVVTSANVLHIAILPDSPSDLPGPRP